ncbi:MULTISPECIES: hypothetical protein [unclassified Duganella]|uniref:hypothetical protein n=1 Tax=unclassified Duganella TaxID=2636909 RepID=UPI00087509A2|nr:MULTISPECIES: hypothetical protein [unclassified Duganella]OEZ54856.1 hypothetical protein DUGA6_56270 [Duganella sp. HH105]OFA00183.1 hypothetical protein DUGA2_50160 [Duganella sp. HH101]
MKKILVAACALCFAFPAFARGGHGGGHAGVHSAGHSAGAPHTSKAATGTGAKPQHTHVGGYTKKDGTQVAAHDRSTKDGTKDNNWSTKGNVNPETGKAGTK